MQKPGDEELMQAVARGDMEAYEQIVLRYQSLAWSIAYRYSGNREDAQDLVQDAFVRLLDAAARYRPSAAFKTYFSCILTRLCLDHARKCRPVACEDLPDIEDASPLPDTVAVQAERVGKVRAAIMGLPAQQRLAVILRYYENYGYKEIAVSLDISEKAAERLLARGREKLAPTLKSYMQE